MALVSTLLSYSYRSCRRIDEEDIVVGSDFESTDEEEQLQVEAAAEAEVANDERRARKVR